MRHLLLGCGWLLAALAANAAAPASRLDDLGQLDRLAMGAGWVRVNTDVRVYQKGWSRNASLSSARDVRATSHADGQRWTATLAPAASQGPAVQVVQTARIKAGQVVFDLKVTGARDGDLEGVFFLVNLPEADFAGGSLQADGKSIVLPKSLPANIGLWDGDAGPLVFTDAAQRAHVRVSLSPNLSIAVQDGRKWAPQFTAMIYLCRGNLAKDQSVQATITLEAEGQPDQTPAHASIDPASVRYRVAGMGGNYCFNLESPTTRQTLDHLQVRAARTEMSLKLWAPKQIAPDVAGTDYRPYAVADTPESRIRRELKLMQELQQKHIPYTISVWRLPAWLGELASREGWQERWRIPPAKWPALLHALGTYLLYAKETYQVEPDYFSFNEADLGVDVWLTAEEHRDALKRLGAHFAKLGLKTKLLLGDVAGPRGSHVYAEPAARDPEVKKYLGAVSFHSWGGAKPDQYAAWAELAQRLNLPLLVAEAGPDPGAWQTRAYRTYPYAVRELVHYQELLLYARPQSILYWEFTGDYSLLAGLRPPPEGPGLTERFCFQKHWCDLILPGSEALASQCDADGVLATAFRSGKHYTLHLSNAKWERPLTITGLPAELKSLRVIRTAEGEYFKTLPAVALESGTLTLTLPAESLTTLTTLEPSPASPMRVSE